MYYVTATDKFLSGWGPAKGKTNKFVLPCETYEEAEYVESKLLNRKEMKYVTIRTSRPYYNQSRYFTTWGNRQECPYFYPAQ